MSPVGFEFGPAGEAQNTANTRTLQELTQTLGRNPLIHGRLVESVTMASGVALDVAHGLPYTHRGWLVVSPNAGVTVMESATAEALQKTHVRLTASANVTIKLWVF